MTDLPPLDPGIEIVAASRGMSKGLAQTDGVQIVAKGELASGPFFVAVQYKNISSATADGEFAASVGVKGKLLGFDAGLTFAHKWLTGLDGQVDPDSVEITPSLSRKLGPVTARASLVFSPDDLGATGSSSYWEGGLAYKLGKDTNLSVNLGRRERERSTDYTAFNVGVTHSFLKNISAELRYYDTSRSGLGEQFESRLVGALRARF